jgi:large subunit ribosomal protein L22
MTGPKRNEGATKVGERTGTRCVVRYVKGTPTKARQVLDLIRGKDVRTADQILQFTERGMAIVVRKALASAVANAITNDGQDAEELKVVACFADEGPTLRRFRPRARGRAMRIRKRTCHITVIVGQMSDRELAVLQAKEGASGGRRARGVSPAAAARRARVERSRQQRAAAKAEDDQPTTQTDELEDATPVIEGDVVDGDEVIEVDEVMEVDEVVLETEADDGPVEANEEEKN